MSPLSERYLDSVVAIEREDGVDDEGNQAFAPLGSGVLVSRPAPDDFDDDPELVDARYIFLVTNRHVIEERDMVWAKMNAGGIAQRFPLNREDEAGNELWHSAGEFDVAVTVLRAVRLRSEEAEFVAIPEELWLTLEEMAERPLGPGDSVSACGFPMGLSGTLKKYAIVRGGTIARMDEELLDEDRCFLLDCLIFPGNSGGPVFDRPSAGDGREPALLGIVSGYLPYEDVAISRQTGKPRVTFEENSGLAAVVPVDAIAAACDAVIEFAREVLADSDDGVIPEQEDAPELVEEPDETGSADPS